MLITSLVLLGGLCAAEGTPVLENAMPIRITGEWAISVGPGSVTKDGLELRLAEPASLAIRPPERIEVRDEAYPELPVFDAKAPGWRKGARLQQLIAEECSATGLLEPESLRIKKGAGATQCFTLDTDYGIDPFWATFGRIEGGAIAKGQAIFVDYDYCPDRLDSIVLEGAGTVRLFEGFCGVGAILPPEAPAGLIVVANIFVSGSTRELTAENLFPIDFNAPDPVIPQPTVAERLLPNTLAKLRAGEKVTIVTWGDSVTDGGGVGSQPELWYQSQFAKRLRERFPKAHVEMCNAAWGGANSRMYIEAPKGGPHDYVRDVLEPKPDLVTIEFVNDAYLDEQGVAEHYGKILADLRGAGAEIVLITPHLVRPDWLTSDTLKVDRDPRKYVKGLKEFAAANRIAVADASEMWCMLWRRGIPYTTLLANSINHPDGRGHAIFADALMNLFPGE